MPIRTISLFVLVALVSACGNSPKVDPTGTKDKPQKPSGPCRADYNPISLFIPGLQAIADPSILPAGTYVNAGTEFYAFDDQRPAGVQHAHFEEIFFSDSSATIRPVCHTVISTSESADYEFPALRLLTIPAPGAGPIAREDFIYQIQNTRGKFVGAVAADPVRSAVGMNGLMAKFSESRLYRTGLTSFELHGEVKSASQKGLVSKWVLQRIQFVPDGTN